MVKVKLFFYDFLLPHAGFYAMELDLVRAFRSPVFEHAQRERGEGANRFDAFSVFDDFRCGVVFLFHV